MWVILPKQCRLGLFQDSDFAGDLEDSKSTSGGTLCVFGSHTFVSNKLDVQETNCYFSQFKQNLISFSLDTGLRLDGLPALELWDLIVFCSWKLFLVFQIDRGNLRVMITNTTSLTNKINVMKDIDTVSFKCPIRASRSFIVCVRRQ